MNNYNETEKILDSIREVVGEYNLENPIHLHEPFFKDTNVFSYLKNCIDNGWVSSGGAYVKDFEKEICEFTGSKYAIAVNNGTVAIRLML